MQGVKGTSSISELEKYPSVQKWKEGLAASTYRGYIYLFEEFMEWLSENSPELGNLTPDELVSYQKQSRKRDEEDAEFLILEYAQRWARSKKGRKGYLDNHLKTLRSFMEFNRTTLPRDRSFRIRGDYAPVPCDLTLDEVRLVVDRSNPTFRAIFLIQWQSTLDQESFITWSNECWPSLKKQLDAGANIVDVDLPGRKNLRFTTSFFTFFGGDALDALRTYIDTKRGLDNGPIFINQFGDPMEKKSLQEYWLRQLRALGLLKPLPGSRKVPRYGRGLHNLRDLARTNWTQRARGDAEQIEFMMGHKVDSNGYFHGEQVRDKMRSHFKTRLPYLNILTSSKPYGLVSEDTVAELQTKLEKVEAEKNATESDLRGQLNEALKAIDKIMKRLDLAE